MIGYDAALDAFMQLRGVIESLSKQNVTNKHKLSWFLKNLNQITAAGGQCNGSDNGEPALLPPESTHAHVHGNRTSRFHQQLDQLHSISSTVASDHSTHMVDSLILWHKDSNWTKNCKLLPCRSHFTKRVSSPPSRPLRDPHQLWVGDTKLTGIIRR